MGIDACQLTSVVQLDHGCSAVLIHPRVLLYPAHCHGPFEHARAGDVQLPIERCQSYPDGTLFGSDLGFCVLREPAHDLALIAPALGCEVDAVTPGAAAWLVGFGTGQKQITQGTVERVDEEIAVAGAGFGACTGDSGGPLLIEVDDGEQRALRVAGILSASSQAECGESTGYFTPLWPFLSWLETESGFDLSACGDPEGSWDPSPECLSYSRALLEPDSCDNAQTTFVSAACGAAHSATEAAVQVHALDTSAGKQNAATCQNSFGRSHTSLSMLLGVVLLGLSRLLARVRR